MTEQTEYTFAMIKSKALSSNLVGMVLDRILHEDFIIVEAQRVFLRPDQIQVLYREHEKKPYYSDLIESVNRGVIAMILKRDGAVAYWRDVMGATDPKKAVPRSIRYWARTEKVMANNIVHGSDSLAAARWEIRTLFPNFMYPAGYLTPGKEA